MSLFGGKKDISFFRNINKELINKIISSYVDVFKKSLYDTNNNIYGESLNKIYFPGIRIAAQIGSEDNTTDYEDNTINRSQMNTFSFLRDSLIDADLKLEIGDLILWNEIYWEVDNIVENNLFLDKNPDTNKTTSNNYGWNVSIICNCHQTTKSSINLEQVRSGNNNTNNNDIKRDSFY